MNEFTETIYRLGRQLSQDPVLLGKAKATRDMPWEGKKRLEILDAFGQTANDIGLPGDMRSPGHLFQNVREIVKVAERFAAQQRLAEVAGEDEFRVGMLVIHYCNGAWLKGRVTALHPNGRFTFLAFGGEPVKADPLYNTTVMVKL